MRAEEGALGPGGEELQRETGALHGGGVDALGNRARGVGDHTSTVEVVGVEACRTRGHTLGDVEVVEGAVVAFVDAGLTADFLALWAVVGAAHVIVVFELWGTGRHTRCVVYVDELAWRRAEGVARFVCSVEDKPCTVGRAVLVDVMAVIRLLTELHTGFVACVKERVGSTLRIAFPRNHVVELPGRAIFRTGAVALVLEHWNGTLENTF